MTSGVSPAVHPKGCSAEIVLSYTAHEVCSPPPVGRVIVSQIPKFAFTFQRAPFSEFRSIEGHSINEMMSVIQIQTFVQCLARGMTNFWIITLDHCHGFWLNSTKTHDSDLNSIN